MAKRFTDTHLYREAWFRKLSPQFKCVWHFLTAECNQIGMWPIDLESLAFHVGEGIDLKNFLNAVNDEKIRVQMLSSSKLLISDFISFQYGNLSEDCKPHRPIIKLLKENETLLKGYPKGFNTLEEKEKDQEKEKEMEMEMERVGGVGEGAVLELPLPKPEKKLPPLAELWNEHCGTLPRAMASNPARAKRCRERMAEADAEAWSGVIKRIAASAFCNGKNKSGWRADLDWILQPEVRLKVLEGKYDNAGPPTAGAANDAFRLVGKKFGEAAV